MNEILRCPVCGRTLPLRPPCECGFLLRESDGILDLLTPAEGAADEPFLAAYERVRAAEGWGGDDLDLPFHPKRHADIWAIRQRSFLKLETLVRGNASGFALDIGAGNCWLTKHLDEWGFDAFAVDINVSVADGLKTGQFYLDRGARFLRVRAGMERLPFVDAGIQLIVANASFHYASDFRAVIFEFHRVLDPAGRIVIIDTPFYLSESDGERMVCERVEQFRRSYGIGEALARRSGYMTRERLDESVRGLDMQYEMHSIPTGLRRTYEKWRSCLLGRRIAEFPMVVLHRS